MKFNTVCVSIEGALCGPIWQPGFDDCQLPINARLDVSEAPVSFESVLVRFLSQRGGDFRRARFTEDTVIVVTRASNNGRRTFSHERAFSVARIAPELVKPGTLTSDCA